MRSEKTTKSKKPLKTEKKMKQNLRNMPKSKENKNMKHNLGKIPKKQGKHTKKQKTQNQKNKNKKNKINIAPFDSKPVGSSFSRSLWFGLWYSSGTCWNFTALFAAGSATNSTWRVVKTSWMHFVWRCLGIKSNWKIGRRNLWVTVGKVNVATACSKLNKHANPLCH